MPTVTTTYPPFMKLNELKWCLYTSANSIPCGSRYKHIPWRWLSRKSSSRRNLTAQSERQSRQYTAISSSRDCRKAPQRRTESNAKMWNSPTVLYKHRVNSTGVVQGWKCVCYPVQLQCKLLVPGLIADWFPACLSYHCVVQLQHCTDLIWGKSTELLTKPQFYPSWYWTDSCFTSPILQFQV